MSRDSHLSTIESDLYNTFWYGLKLIASFFLSTFSFLAEVARKRIIPRRSSMIVDKIGFTEFQKATHIPFAIQISNQLIVSATSSQLSVLKMIN